MEIKYNKRFNRYEVFSDNGLVRNGELQPVYVDQSIEAAEQYIQKVKQHTQNK